MSKEEKTEKEFEPIIVSEPRPRYGVLTDMSLYIHPLSAPNISEGDGYIEIGNINVTSNTILIENTCTFTDRDASCYRLAVADINKIQIKFINSDMCSVVLYPEGGGKIAYLIKTNLYITILENTVIIDTHKYWTDNEKELPYKCILDYL